MHLGAYYFALTKLISSTFQYAKAPKLQNLQKHSAGFPEKRAVQDNGTIIAYYNYASKTLN